MSINDWNYYNHAMISLCAPHETPDLTCINNNSIWRLNGKRVVFARWTEDFDTTESTDWWYIVQDNPIVLSEIKRKHRKKINKGLSNFDCRVINPKDYSDRMAEITISAWKTYPEKYRPNRSIESLVKEYNNCKDLVFGCFNKDGLLCGFDCVEDRKTYWSLAQGKTDPEWERGFELNAAMTYTEIDTLRNDIVSGKYLTNGMRNTMHETNFNDDLCHYYGFRRVYCTLHLAYNPKYEWIIKLLFPIRSIVSKFEKFPLVNAVSNLLKMEEIARKQRT